MPVTKAREECTRHREADTGQESQATFSTKLALCGGRQTVSGSLQQEARRVVSGGRQCVWTGCRDACLCLQTVESFLRAE